MSGHPVFSQADEAWLDEWTDKIIQFHTHEIEPGKTRLANACVRDALKNGLKRGLDAALGQQPGPTLVVLKKDLERLQARREGDMHIRAWLPPVNGDMEVALYARPAPVSQPPVQDMTMTSDETLRTEFEAAMGDAGYEMNPTRFRDGSYTTSYYEAGWLMFNAGRAAIKPGTVQWCEKCGEGAMPGICRRKDEYMAPAAWGQHLTAYQLAEQIADVPDVHEALEAFSHDSTAENAIHLICAVRTATHGADPTSVVMRQALDWFDQADALDSHKWPCWGPIQAALRAALGEVQP